MEGVSNSVEKNRSPGSGVFFTRSRLILEEEISIGIAIAGLKCCLPVYIPEHTLMDKILF